MVYEDQVGQVEEGVNIVSGIFTDLMREAQSSAWNVETVVILFC